jgi:hypothetical protein
MPKQQLLSDTLLNLIMIDKGLVLSSVDAVNLSFYFIVIIITKHKQEK